MVQYIIELLEERLKKILFRYFKKPVMVDVPVSFTVQIK